MANLLLQTDRVDSTPRSIYPPPAPRLARRTMPGPPSPSVQPAKRQRQSSLDETSPRDAQTSPADQSSEGAAPTAKPGQSSNFRNVSACNRCRLRKNRCDQRLPSCASCAKVGVACVGYDPITKKEIPRRYVHKAGRCALCNEMLMGCC